MSSLRFVDWFAGAGGIRLGLERAGHRCVWACEKAEFARAVYAARWGHEPEAMDILDVEPGAIPEADLWAGGFPCQDLSPAGLRAGINGARSGLVWRLLDLAAERRPEWLFLENVRGLLTGKGGEEEDEPEDQDQDEDAESWFGMLLGALAERGYVGHARVFDAQHFGVPQRRRRVFILARRVEKGPACSEILLESAGASPPVAFWGAREGTWTKAQRDLFRVSAPFSGPWGSVTAWDEREVWTRNLPELPEAGPVPSTLLDILERGPVDKKYYLSPRACAGVLRRAERRGRRVPEPLRTALEWVASRSDADAVLVLDVAALVASEPTPGLGAGYARSNDGPLVAGPVPASTGGPDDNDAQQGRLIASTVKTRNTRNTPDDILVASTVTAAAGHHGRSSPIAMPVTAREGKGPWSDAGSGNLVAAALTGGGHPGSAIPGRHREDDENLVAAPRAFVLNADGSTAKESAAREVSVARCLDTTGGFAAGQGGTVVLAFDPTRLTHPENRSRCQPGEPAPSLAAKARPPHVAVRVPYSVVPEGGQGADLRASEVAVAPALTATSEASKTERGLRLVEDGVLGWTVRRLTPRECERLQALPDDWTLIEGASDSKRYEVIGNGVAVVVIEWIGWRLARWAGGGAGL